MINNTKIEQGNITETPSIANDKPTGETKVTKKRRKFGIKRILLILLLLFAGYITYSILNIFISPDRNIRQIYLVPKDAAFIIESSEPVKDWQKFSSSAPWQTLKQGGTFAEISENTELLDSIIRNNKTLLSLVGKRDLTISLHKTRSRDWDFLIIADLKKASKIQLLRDQLENILKLGGGSVTQRNYNGVNIVEMRDPDTSEILYTAFIDNHFVASYTLKLVEASIDERESPAIGREDNFILAERSVSGRGLYRVYINYSRLPSFLSIYLRSSNEYIEIFSKSMDFAGLFFNVDDSKMEVKGTTFQRESADLYLSALLNSGKKKMKAHEILSARTAFYTNISFDNASKFINELEKAMREKDPAAYESFAATRKKVENYFGISLQDNFISWMAGEFAIMQSEPGQLGGEQDFILAIRAKNIKNARKNMELIEKKVRGRSPIKIKSVDYKGYPINYVEMKGFFRLFFGNLFDRFEKPYYTYVEDYVVFSNKASSLLSFVEDFRQKNLLRDQPGFKQALSRMNNSSTIFLYADMDKFCTQLRSMLAPDTWKEIDAHKDIFDAFPFWTLQVTGNGAESEMHYVMDYDPEKRISDISFEIIDDVDELDKEMNENAVTEKELMNELKRFYVEKFEGNVLREYYPEGELLSETEIRNGQKNGRHREYYQDGKLKLRGKYVKNRPKGTWKYYTNEGKFERKEKY